MFPRGPRFDPAKISDVPGPNSYNLAQESQLDAYKRGAFLEKTDRFLAEKASDVPGPGTYNADIKKPAKKAAPAQQPNWPDRYAILQRKVEELEQVHKESNVTHKSQIEHLKLELARSQKLAAEHADRLEKQKHQNEAISTRLQDLKKAAHSDQAEIKDLRVKLRLSEHERTQLSSKQGEVGDLKKALHLSESKRKDDVKEKSRRIVELEKCLAEEMKKREAAEEFMKDKQRKIDDEIQRTQTAAKHMEIQMKKAEEENSVAQSTLAFQRDETHHKEQELLLNLALYQRLVQDIAADYGRLASSSIPEHIHTSLKHDHTTLQVRLLRLERKLANSEGQVVELANLIRYVKEENSHISQQLRDAEEELRSYHHRFRAQSFNTNRNHDVDTAIHMLVESIQKDILEADRHTEDAHWRNTVLVGELHCLLAEEFLSSYLVTDATLSEQRLIVQAYIEELSDASITRKRLESDLKIQQLECTTTQDQLESANESKETYQKSVQALTTRLAEMDAHARECATRNENALKKEQQAAHRALQRGRTAQDALLHEIERLTTELMDAERYQEAYYKLSDEVGSLLAKNELAEHEASTLSKFNAEILGHSNPAQRIMYVDRIRKELAETKFKLVLSMRDQEAAIAQANILQHELDMYTSVMVPVGEKPRTAITRVGRPLPANLSDIPESKPSVNIDLVDPARHIPTTEDNPGDVTLDENQTI